MDPPLPVSADASADSAGLTPPSALPDGALGEPPPLDPPLPLPVDEWGDTSLPDPAPLDSDVEALLADLAADPSPSSEAYSQVGDFALDPIPRIPLTQTLADAVRHCPIAYPGVPEALRQPVADLLRVVLGMGHSAYRFSAAEAAERMSVALRGFGVDVRPEHILRDCIEPFAEPEVLAYRPFPECVPDP